jgi:hypothetical protein
MMRLRSVRGLRALVGLGASVVLLGALEVRVAARAEGELPYPLHEVFSTALRFVRVDRGCKVTDKDAEAAYVMFECPGERTGSVRSGAVELFSRRDPASGVRVQVSLPDETHGTELRFLELLERKLRDERGVPAVRRPAAPAPSPSRPPDGGAPASQ